MMCVSAVCSLISFCFLLLSVMCVNCSSRMYGNSSLWQLNPSRCSKGNGFENIVPAGKRIICGKQWKGKSPNESDWMCLTHKPVTLFWQGKSQKRHPSAFFLSGAKKGKEYIRIDCFIYQVIMSPVSFPVTLLITEWWSDEFFLPLSP